MAKRMRDPVEGTFRVVATSPPGLDEDDGIWVAGVISGEGVRPVAADVTAQGPWRGGWVPKPGDEIPAMIDRADPARVEILWPPKFDLFTEMTLGRAYAERVAAAMRLGLDPAGVPADEPPPSRVRAGDAARAQVLARNGSGPLPDGRPPIGTDEAERLARIGEAAVATVTGIDFLLVDRRVLPNPDASLANVALRVRPADGADYPAVSRFGFRDAARRAQIGFVGAEVPVRIDPADRTRVTLDAARLPPPPE